MDPAWEARVGALGAPPAGSPLPAELMTARELLERQQSSEVAPEGIGEADDHWPPREAPL